MTVDQLIVKVRNRFKNKECPLEGRTAVQVNLTGKIGGVFYIELLNGEVSVMPYEYIDRDAMISTTLTNFEKLMTGRLDLMTAVSEGKVKVEGNTEKVLFLTELMK